MATVKQFEELAVWQRARALVKEVCASAQQPAFHRDFSLRDPIRRAATSTMPNIAEGLERRTRREFILQRVTFNLKP